MAATIAAEQSAETMQATILARESTTDSQPGMDEVNGVPVKVMSQHNRPPLSKDDITQRSIRSGTLKMHLETTSVLFGKVRQWKERFVHIDQTDGIYFCVDRDSFERRDKRNIKRLPFSDIAGVMLKRPEGQNDSKLYECRFVLYIKPKAQASFGPEIELESPAGIQDAEEWVNALKQKILVKARVFTVGLNGEFPEHARGVKPNVAICFSGGGGRAHVCAASQLRALHHMGLLNKDKIDYISGVSAGAWATCVYQFYRKGAANDDELFGELMSTDLKKWTLNALDTTQLSPLLRPALDSCMKVASELVWTTNSHELWEHVMGNIFLKPFGLYKELPYCMREDVEEIKRENPHLANMKFIVPRENRPFWICHGTIIGPEWAKLGDLLPIQFSALYTGSPYLHKMHYKDGMMKKTVDRNGEERVVSKRREEVVWVGGGMVESFAFGGDEPTAHIGSSGRALNTTSILPSPLAANGSFRNFLSKRTSSRATIAGSKKKNAAAAANTLKSPESTLEINTATASDTTTSGNTTMTTTKRVTSLTGKIPSMASQAFADLVSDQFANKFKQKGLPQYSNEINEAMATLNLGPQMVQRVFRHAQEALKTQSFYQQKSKDEDDGSEDEGVLMKQVKLPYPSTPFNLRHTLGISSDAPSVNLHEKTTFKRLNVQARYWTPLFVNASLVEDAAKSLDATEQLNMSQNIATTKAVTMDMGDGGSLDNLGLCGMLQRGVRKLVIFCNTNNLVPSPFAPKPNGPVKLEFDANRRLSITSPRQISDGSLPVEPALPPPSPVSTPTRRASLRLPGMSSTPTPVQTGPPIIPMINGMEMFNQLPQDDTPPTFGEWADDDILPLFGQAVDEKMLNYLGTHHSLNHVFPLSELRPLLRQFQEKLVKGEPIVVRSQHEVLDNPFWGIIGGWKVDIVWVYLDDAYLFRQSLPDDTMQELDKGKGDLARFPNFKTFGNNSTFSFDIALTSRQINLLSLFTEWQLTYHKDLINEFINEPLPPLERKKKTPQNCLSQLEVEGFC